MTTISKDLEEALSATKCAADQARLDACPIKSGMTVVRKSSPGVKGYVVGCFTEWYSPFRPTCRVEWEKATNGARRINGRAFRPTTCVLASKLRQVNSEADQ